MVQGPGKVYEIGSPGPSPKGAAPARTPTLPQAAVKAAASNRSAADSVETGKKSWKQVILAYLLGPVLVVTQVKGQGKFLWALLGPVAVVAGITMLVAGTGLRAWLDRVPYGISIWLLAVPLVILSIATAWARSLASAGRHRPRGSHTYRPWMRDPRFVAPLGLLAPGLGLLFAGHRHRAAWAFWTLGPLAAAGVVLLHWRWLWGRSVSEVPAGVSGPGLEAAFLLAGVVLVFASLAWIVQALDGARRVTVEARRIRPDLVSAGLVFALVLFVATARPASFARVLDATSAELQLAGLQIIPLGLSEVAIRLAPTDAGYLARAAELDEALGRSTAAFNKRVLLQNRAREYMGAVGISAPERRDEPAPVPTVPEVLPAEAAGSGPWSGITSLYE